MTTAADILYPEAGPLERALATAGSDVLPVPLRELLDPAKTPVAFLGFLAAHESVDLWFDDWPVERKRQMVQAARDGLAALKGTRAAAPAFLAFVDAVLLDKVSYPSRFVLGRSRVGRGPIGHPAFVARHLVKVETRTPPGALVLGRSRVGRAAFKPPSREPFRRVLVALRTAKAPDTEFRVDFAHKRWIRLSDRIPLDGSARLGGFLDRVRL